MNQYWIWILKSFTSFEMVSIPVTAWKDKTLEEQVDSLPDGTKTHITKLASNYRWTCLLNRDVNGYERRLYNYLKDRPESSQYEWIWCCSECYWPAILDSDCEYINFGVAEYSNVIAWPTDSLLFTDYEHTTSFRDITGLRCQRCCAALTNINSVYSDKVDEYLATKSNKKFVLFEKRRILTKYIIRQGAFHRDYIPEMIQNPSVSKLLDESMHRCAEHKCYYGFTL